MGTKPEFSGNRGGRGGGRGNYQARRNFNNDRMNRGGMQRQNLKPK